MKHLLASLFLIAACGGTGPQRQAEKSEDPPPPVEDPTAPDQATNCGVSAEPDVALSPEQCTCLGGEVRGDIGDGQIKCNEGERELGRVATGIEGGVCCAAGDATAP
jgi:hypothetical protein